jgi:hypothetical protein
VGSHLHRNRDGARVAFSNQRNTMNALSPAQQAYAAALDEIEKAYAAELPNTQRPEQLAILKVRRMSASYVKLIAATRETVRS